ncbi:NAD(P)-binding protein [Auriscalpium vulgare]|uniref:NAD(P)-binding protein n=1 Tax=Auriscalpium vulgare TaxID=40419 RepID=A0ACB8S1N0_9AGAM|nr:NAD(P)-binding protein [Auriscalpium vulgare]
MTTWTGKTKAVDAASALQNEIRGKNVLVTGVSPNSLGAETVRVLAPYAQSVILAGRSQSKIDETIAAVKAQTPTASLKSVILDLASIESIKQAAAEVNALAIPIHAVINNAASAQHKTIVKTADGFEAQFGINHLGHFLFTSLIMPSVRRAVGSVDGFAPRIVAVASAAHSSMRGAIRFDDLFFEKRPEEYDSQMAYAASKTANIQFVRLLARKLAPEGILAFSLHPGVILETGMGSVPTVEELHGWGLVDKNGKPYRDDTLKTIEEGTSTQVIAAFDPNLKDRSGVYLLDGVPRDDLVADCASDDAVAERLWVLSEKLVGQPFDVKS